VTADKYTRSARDWTMREYADSQTYLRRRSELIAPGLAPDDVVLDLACGDGGLAGPLGRFGLRYRGVDLNEAMVAEARRRGVDAVHADLNVYLPEEPVAATTLFRALYYARDRPSFFEHVASYTRKKLVFDVNPRQYALAAVTADLRAAGFEAVSARPFFVPQRLPLGPLEPLARSIERLRPVARLVLRFRFTYVVVAERSAPS